jgi:hypothetical protein
MTPIVAYTDFADPNRKWYNNKRCVPPTWIFIPLWDSVRSKPHYPQLLDFPSVAIWHIFYLGSLNIDFFRLITSLTNSYDGNIVNSFQALPQWMRYFHNPAGAGLTLLNSMQVNLHQIQCVRTLISSSVALWVPRCTSHDSFCSGWFGTTHFHFHWCIGFVSCHRHSDCGQLPRHVHCCSVSFLFHNTYYCLSK